MPCLHGFYVCYMHLILINLVCVQGKRYNVFKYPYTAPPIALAFNETELPGAERDRELGTLYVGGLGSMVTVPVIVEAGPCPSVQWSFKGSNIANGDNYTITNPCVANAESPFTFMLTVTNLTNETSGAYSAIFNNLAGDGMLPDLYITLEGTIEMSFDVLVFLWFIFSLQLPLVTQFLQVL